jgi:glucose-6-phosphate isomerase
MIDIKSMLSKLDKTTFNTYSKSFSLDETTLALAQAVANQVNQDYDITEDWNDELFINVDELNT